MNVQNFENRSIHSDNVEEVHNVPMDVIIRPIPPVLDEQKVQSLMNTIKVKVSYYNIGRGLNYMIYHA